MGSTFGIWKVALTAIWLTTSRVVISMAMM
jgi:hypothetical protein